MTRQEKATIIDDLKDKFANNGHFYITDASGLSVAQINAFRRLCFEKGVEYRVFKNTLIKKALQDVEGDYDGLNDVLKGSSGVMFVEEAANIPAKIITEYRKKQGGGKPLLKAASIERDLFIGEDHLKSLSQLKSKNELLGEVIGLLQSPAKNVLSALQSGKGTLGGLIKTLAEREN
ncbi:50S ribosomal protein L10 [Fulvivirga sp. M361]|uniref:50S ribosomal protein L10 n=1 Tax=Fulvivirga sp. M361 TaxID=2594266 RepID=UPI001179FE68|nr:50S ribosomal protein L10 [Fulvivirga sp. M361]TRX55586.1 50S ribosomal protein L10 [Fulvivirga sp. M361]